MRYLKCPCFSRRQILCKLGTHLNYTTKIRPARAFTVIDKIKAANKKKPNQAKAKIELDKV